MKFDLKVFFQNSDIDLKGVQFPNGISDTEGVRTFINGSNDFISFGEVLINFNNVKFIEVKEIRDES